ncbi:MAG: aldolase [Candidatus Hydrogenedentes bacterium]|nr:aldolase [Candidatus Hydrogenedentota bacterium]
MGDPIGRFNVDGESLSLALRGGRRVYGTCITSIAPHWLGMASELRLDFAFLDTEHTPIDRGTLSWLCRYYRELGIAPIVRIPSPDPYQACCALDGGASGIIAPYVETVEQVQSLRGAVKLRPLKGDRLTKILTGEDLPEPELDRYIHERNAGNVLVINVESRPALDRLDDLLAVPGLDAVLIGPHDLSCSLGVPEQYGHPTFLAAVSTIISKSRAANVGVGLHYSEDTNREIEWAREGANFIVHSSDQHAARMALRAEFDVLRRSMGDAQ